MDFTLTTPTTDTDNNNHLPAWAMKMEKRLSTMERLMEENMTLKADLEKAQKTIKKLETQLTTQKNQQLPNNTTTATIPIFTFGDTSTQDSVHATSNSTTTPSYAAMAKKTPQKDKGKKKQENQKKKKELAKLQNPTEGMIDWAVRSLQTPLGPKGYDFIYLATPRRTSPGQLRKIFTIFGVNTKRIIDIHAPTRGIVGLLIHQSFKEELIDTLAKKNITPIEFNPLAASIIADPLYANDTDDVKSAKATDIHHQRIAKICKRMKNKFLGNAIITHFHHTEGPHHIPESIHYDHFHPLHLDDPTDSQLFDFTMTTDSTPNNSNE
jgi:hypothetical protein